jgi:hypothetical protein
MALCTRRPPTRTDDGAAPVSKPSVPTYFRMLLYNEFLDNAMQTIKSRMDRSALKFYCTVEDAVLPTSSRQLAASDLDAHLTTICEHFKEDVDRNRLLTNFAMLLPELTDGQTADTPTDITVDALVALGPAKRLCGDLVKLVVLMFVMPATSATAERRQCHSSAEKLLPFHNGTRTTKQRHATQCS